MYLWRAVEGSMLEIWKLIFLGHVCDITTLKREGLNELPIARYWELHGYVPTHIRVPLLLLPLNPYRCTYQVGQKSEKLGKIGYHLWVRKFFDEKWLYYRSIIGLSGSEITKVYCSFFWKCSWKKFVILGMAQNGNFQYIWKIDFLPEQPSPNIISESDSLHPITL